MSEEIFRHDTKIDDEHSIASDDPWAGISNIESWSEESTDADDGKMWLRPLDNLRTPEERGGPTP